MTVASALLVASTCAYAGFQTTIRFLVYPQLARTPPASFTAAEREHQRRVTYLVGPLFAFFGLTAALDVVLEPALWTWLTAGCYLAILAVTGLAAVPQHRALTAGFDAAAMARLLLVDSVRLVLALVACVAAVLHAIT